MWRARRWVTVMYEFCALQGGHRPGATASAWSERQSSVDRRRVPTESQGGLTPPSLALPMRRAPQGPSASQPGCCELDRHRRVHLQEHPWAVFSTRRWKWRSKHTWLPVHARICAVPACMRSYALVHARGHPPGPHAGGGKIPHESVKSGWLRGGTEQLPRLATRSWRAHRPCQRTAQPLRRLREHHPATGRCPARVPVCPHRPTGNSKTSRKQLRRSPPPGWLECVRACVRACVRLRIHVRVCARMRTLDVYVRACMQCDP